GLLRIDDPSIDGRYALSYNETSCKWEYRKIIRQINRGLRSTIVVRTTRGNLTCTKDHPLMTMGGWRRAEMIRAGDYIYAPVVAAARSLCRRHGGGGIAAIEQRENICPLENTYAGTATKRRKRSTLLESRSFWRNRRCARAGAADGYQCSRARFLPGKCLSMGNATNGWTTHLYGGTGRHSPEGRILRAGAVSCLRNPSGCCLELYWETTPSDSLMAGVGIQGWHLPTDSCRKNGP